MMTTLDKKHEIMDSLESLDHAQTLQVLNFIHVLTGKSKADKDYEQFRREALTQISLALHYGAEMPSTF